MKTDIVEELDVVEGITVSYDNGTFKATGPAGEVVKTLRNPRIDITIKENKVTIKTKKATRTDNMHINTFLSHIRNTMNGAKEPFTYELKICSGHFPMSAAVNGETFELKNFLGESAPRKTKIQSGVKVQVNGDIITVEASSKEAAGQMAATLEQLTRITNRDRRIFQDGIYITKKAGKKL